jgi:hypothetical protein
MRRVALIGGVVIVLLAIAVAVVSWLLASLLVVPKHDLTHENVAVRAVRAGTVALGPSTATRRPGVYGLQWSDGHAIAGAIVGEDRDGVSRRLTDVHGTLAAGMKVAIDASVYVGTPRSSRGLDYRDVAVPDPLGPMPAWLVPAAGSDTWAIFVHGIDGTRAAGLRVLPTLHAAGLPTLLVSYRNDPGAPPSPDHLIHLGQTEWRDLEAAARWALGHGARRLVLVGQSMGGAIVTRFMRVSALAPRVTALVLDAPALDWRSIVDAKASDWHLPTLAALPVRTTIGLRIGFDWSAMDEIAHAADFQLPILLFQGLDDQLVPPADSAEFARRLPGLVEYVPVPHAGHIESWNVDPAAYDRRLTAFLGRVVRGAGSPGRSPDPSWQRRDRPGSGPSPPRCRRGSRCP